MSFHTIDLAMLRESKKNPRRHYDPQKLKDLAASLKVQGQLQPILVRPVTDAPGYFEIAAGHRRYKAAKMESLPSLEAVVRDMTDAQFMELITLENLDREELHPYDEALGYKALMDECGYTVEMVASKRGVSPSEIYRRLKLVNLTERVASAFLEGKFTAGHALHFARLQPADQVRTLKMCTDEVNHFSGGEFPSATRLADWIQRNIQVDLATAPFSKTDPDLYPQAGPCTTCPKRTGHQNELVLAIDGAGGKKGDKCLDPACFAVKVTAHLKAAVEQLRAEDGDAVELSQEYGNQKKGGPLMADKWFEAKPTAEGARRGLVVKGPLIGKVVHFTKDRPVVPRGPAMEQHDARSKAAEKKRKLELKRRRLILTMLRERVRDRLGGEDLAVVVYGFLREMQFESRKQLCRMMGWEPAKAKKAYGPALDYDGVIRKSIGALEDPERMRLLILLPLVCQVDRQYHPSGTPDELMLAAQRYKIDLKKVDASIAAEGEKKKAVPKTPRKRLAGDVRRARLKGKTK